MNVDICSRPLQDERSIAKSLNVSQQFLREDRYGKKRIPFIRLGRRILYDPAMVSEALQNMVIRGKHET